jgi:hypothetical protein
MAAEAEERKAALDPSADDYEVRLMTLELIAQSSREIEVWIGRADYLPRQLKQDRWIPFDSGQGHSSSTMKLYDFNQQVEIRPPLDASGELLPRWELVGG